MIQWTVLILSHRSFSLLALLCRVLVITYRGAFIFYHVTSRVGKMVEVLARAGADVNYPHEVGVSCLFVAGVSDSCMSYRANSPYLRL